MTITEIDEKFMREELGEEGGAAGPHAPPLRWARCPSEP